MGNQVGKVATISSPSGVSAGTSAFTGSLATVGIGSGSPLVVTPPQSDAVDDVFAFIQLFGLAGLQTGWSLFRRRMADKPTSLDRAVVVSEDGGPQPEIKEAAGIGDSALRDVGVMVSVRAGAWDSDASKDKAFAILAALHGLMNALVGATTYNRVRALTPEPIFAGFDDTGRPRHTIAFRLLRAAA